MAYVSTKFYFADANDASVIAIILKAKYICHTAVMTFYIHEVKNHELTYLMKVLPHASFLGPVLSVGSFHLTNSRVLHIIITDCRKFKSTIL
jgi:hypothetical protein